MFSSTGTEFENVADSFFTASLLSAAIKKLGDFDLVLCGRQASDWDNAQVPLGVAELLGIPCITIAKNVQVGDGKVTVERVVPDGYEVIEGPLPSLVTVSNELGQPRYPTLRGIMAATRKKPTGVEPKRLGRGLLPNRVQAQSRGPVHTRRGGGVRDN